MAVYVDNSMIAWRGKRWCHLTGDTLDELHEFAKRLGLKRAWFQERPQLWLCHYDVTAGKRVQALALGAVDETWSEAGKRALAAAKASVMPEFEMRTCHECGCTAESACWHDELGHCSWVAGDLCNACEPDADPEWEHPFVMGERDLHG